MVEPSLVWPVGALLGEGPVWLPDEGALRFVDIKGGGLHRFVPATGQQETLDIGGQPSFILPAGNGRFVIGSGTGLLTLMPEGPPCVPILDIPMPLHNRTNDATADSCGRLWFGTMDDTETQRTGALWCLDRGELHRMGGDAIVTNGPAVTRDGSMLYHVDSAARTIWRFPIEDGPRLGTGEVFLQLSEADGYPDGVVLDSEGCLWVALWDGWGVQRYGPDGRLLMRVELPCARVTKIAFGGANLRTAFVTTARVGLSDEALADQPLAGGLFAFEAPVAGLPLPAVRL